MAASVVLAKVEASLPQGERSAWLLHEKKIVLMPIGTGLGEMSGEGPQVWRKEYISSKSPSFSLAKAIAGSQCRKTPI